MIGQQHAPADEVFGNIISYAVGDDGTIYVLDMTDPGVRVFDSNGRFRRKIGRQGRGPAEFDRPYRIAARRDRFVVYDIALNRLSRFDSAGTLLTTGTAPFNGGANFMLTLTADDHVLLAAFPPDSSAPGQIQELDANFRLVRSFGEPVTPAFPDDGALLSWGAVAAADDGTVWFSPASDYEIRRYGSNGALLSRILREHDFQYNPRPFLQSRPTDDGRIATGFDVDRPLSTALVLDRWGYLWHFVRDVPNERIVVDAFDRSGVFVHSSTWPLQSGPGAMDSQRRFYRISQSAGYPQLIRFAAENLDMGGTPCIDE